MTVATDAPPVYDSSVRRTPLVTEFRNFWRHRGLIRLLVSKDLTVRYKRSYLGAGWTLLQPLLTTAVMWIIFTSIFGRQAVDGVPFIVYLLSGILLAHVFSHGIVAAGGSLHGNRGVLSKVHVPPEVFAFTAAISAGAHFLISLLPLFVAQLVATTEVEGVHVPPVGIPWTVLLTPIPVLCLLLLVTGLGLMIATAAIRYDDVLPLTQVLSTLVVYLGGTFYPVDRIDPQLRRFILWNPLYSYITVFRRFVYGGEVAPLWNWAVMLGTTAVGLTVGVWVFSRRWKDVVVML